MCEPRDVWENRVNGNICMIKEVERPEFGEPIVRFAILRGPDTSDGHQPLEQFLRYWRKVEG